MAWVLRSPQIHSTFGNLGQVTRDGYHVNPECSANLETILKCILTEDKLLRLYRRHIFNAQILQKELIPLLLHVEEDKILELLIRILENLTKPAECLFLDVKAATECVGETVNDINNLLTAAKTAFAYGKVTKIIINFLKKNLGSGNGKLSTEQCTNISNVLLLLRNILHVPDEAAGGVPNKHTGLHSIQNRILWNIFTQSIDKILIKLMTIPEATHWPATMVQLIALLYKDQHLATMQKLLTLWHEATISDSSEDNESNTSNPSREGSPILVSEASTSSVEWVATAAAPCSDVKYSTNGNDVQGKDQTKSKSTNANNAPEHHKNKGNRDRKARKYTSTSSNEDELLFKKPVHLKPKKPKSTKSKVQTTKDKKWKKVVKRGKSKMMMNMQLHGREQKTPSDDDISHLIKEFTIDFILKGYNALVNTLHNKILSNEDINMDISYFFWLITYFLKFTTQLELDWEHVSSVMTPEMVSYLTAAGVNLCEQHELAIKLDRSDLKTTLKRLHLVVTAIREVIRATDAYEKSSRIGDKGRLSITSLGEKISRNEELHSLFVLLLRHYNNKYYTKQYLQDLIVTNHMLLAFLDGAMKIHKPTDVHSLKDHMRQFCNGDVMYRYGLLLEDYLENGEMVNDCIFTLMHHVGGELDSLISLYQPRLLNTFIAIWNSKFTVCDDWSDLIEYVINTFVKKPQTLRMRSSVSERRLKTQCFEDMEHQPEDQESTKHTDDTNTTSHSDQGSYMRYCDSPNVVEDVTEMLNGGGIKKTRGVIISELYRQNLVNQKQYKSLSRVRKAKKPKSAPLTKEMKDDEIRKLCDQLILDEKSKSLEWLQKVLLETCLAKIYFEKKAAESKGEVKVDSKIFGNNLKDLPVISSVAWLALLYNQSVPLVPWNCEQAVMSKDLKFLQLAHKLGFHMAVDTGKVLMRIPNFWTSRFIYDVAIKLSPVDKAKLKFSVSDLWVTAYLTPPMTHEHEDVIMTSTLESYEHYKIIKTTFLTTPLAVPSASADTSQNWLEIVKRSRRMTIGERVSTSQLGLSTTAIKKEMEEVELLLDPEVPSTRTPSPGELVSPSTGSLNDSDYDADSFCKTASVTSDQNGVSDEDSFAETASVAWDQNETSVSDEDSFWETASRASDHDGMYVSEEEDDSGQVADRILPTSRVAEWMLPAHCVAEWVVPAHSRPGDYTPGATSEKRRRL